MLHQMQVTQGQAISRSLSGLRGTQPEHDLIAKDATSEKDSNAIACKGIACKAMSQDNFI